MTAIVSVFDYSGRWSSPYKRDGYEVIQVDQKLGDDIRTIERKRFPSTVHGILLAPPCTDFSVSGAQYWKQKDEDGRTFQSIALMDAGLRLVCILKPKFWSLENPVGRIRKWLGEPRLWFHPYYYAGFSPDPEQDRYTKKTALYGTFNEMLPLSELEPIRACKQGSWIQKLGGKSDKTKELRSMTPLGFAEAFYKANP